ncbi:unnamed protein product [Rhizophagus irregularis]|nr:unnamed protein product [Rhizophagus irregularis]
MVQGRKFINSMNIDHLSYFKTKVLTYEDEEYYLHHRPIFDAVKELLSNPDILKNCQWDFSPEYIINDNGQNEHATTLDRLGKDSEHPVYLSLGNIANWRRNKCDAKVLLGFLPKLKQLHNRKNNKDNFVLAKRMLYQHCFDIMTQPIYEILENNGLDIITDNQIIWAFPFLSEFIGDLPEDAALTLTYASSRCKRPCHICTVTIDELNNPNLSRSQVELRTSQNMHFVLNNNLCHEFSIYPLKNIFWKFCELNIYSTTVPDRMHHCDLGIDEFDRRLAEIPRFPELKTFKHGLDNIARFTV